MSCQELMNANPPVLSRGDTVASALAKLREEKRMSLPVVDASGKYLGLFGAHQILMLAMPKAAMADDEQPLAFISESIKDIESRLASVAKHTVERYMDTEIQLLTPQTAAIETLHLLYLHREDLPVVDPNTKKLLGIVTIRSSLGKLMVKQDERKQS